jgi:hypothetical protein
VCYLPIKWKLKRNYGWPDNFDAEAWAHDHRKLFEDAYVEESLDLKKIFDRQSMKRREEALDQEWLLNRWGSFGSSDSTPRGPERMV